jgi:hypothetical protein
LLSVTESAIPALSELLRASVIAYLPTEIYHYTGIRHLNLVTIAIDCNQLQIGGKQKLNETSSADYRYA